MASHIQLFTVLHAKNERTSIVWSVFLSVLVMFIKAAADNSLLYIGADPMGIQGFWPHKNLVVGVLCFLEPMKISLK